MSSTRRSHASLLSPRALTLSLLLAGCRAETAPELPRLHPAATPAEAAAGAAELVRRGYLGRDWWACARDGAALRLLHPDSAPLQAWTILCVSRSGGDALAQADAMLSERPGDPWALFARAGALVDQSQRGAEAVQAARAARAALPEHPDFVWQLARALVVHGGHAEVTAFFAALPQPKSAALLALELAHRVELGDDQGSRVFELADQARAADPRCVDAEFLPALWLLSRRRPAEAMPLLARALELSPHSPALHAELWRAIQQSHGLTPSERNAAIEADVAQLLAARRDAPAAWKATADITSGMSKETSEALTAELLARFPTSREADYARLKRVHALSGARHERRTRGTPDPAEDARFSQAIDDVLAHPPADSDLLAEVYLLRHDLLAEDEHVAPERLLAALQDWAAHEQRNLIHLAFATADLAGRTPHAVEAEAVARTCVERAEAQLTRYRARASDPAEVDKNSGYLLAPAYGALGTALLAQGRRAEARDALDRAYALERTHPRLLKQMAALAEAEGRIADAEKFLVEGAAQWGGQDLCEKALRALYVRQNGSERGYERHREQIEVDIRERRRAEVLATAIAEPKPLPAFALKKLGGGELRSDALRGRVAVINLWSTTCHPCVAEMPALQQLAEANAGARDVVVTTINLDEPPDHLPAWMTAHDLRLEAALGGRYAADNGYDALPTTLFVDRRGDVVFTKVGATEKLVEEFTWRIDALRRRPAGPG